MSGPEVVTPAYVGRFVAWLALAFCAWALIWHLPLLLARRALARWSRGDG